MPSSEDWKSTNGGGFPAEAQEAEPSCGDVEVHHESLDKMGENGAEEEITNKGSPLSSGESGRGDVAQQDELLLGAPVSHVTGFDCGSSTSHLPSF